MSSIENEHTPSQMKHNIHIVFLTLSWLFIPPIYGVVVWFKNLSIGQKIVRTFSIVFSPMTYVFLGLLIAFFKKQVSESHNQPPSEASGESDSEVEIIPDYIQTKDEEISPDLLTSFIRNEACGHNFLCSDSNTSGVVYTYMEEVEEGEGNPLYLQTFTGGLITIQKTLDEILRNDFALDLTMEEHLTLSDLFMIWFGNPLFLSPEEGDLFKKVDVNALKKWKAFLPQASDSWNGQTYQEIYSTLFQDFARLFSIGYVSLQSEDIDATVQEYIALAEQDIGEEYSIKALEYLQNKYNNRFSELHGPLKAQSESDNDHWGEIFQPYMSIGFWLRRHHDGSAKILWDMTHGILKEYDPEWISELQTKYPNAKIWDTPIKMTTETSLFHEKERAYVKVDDTAVFFELWIDGRNHQLNKVAAVTPGKHIVSSVNCLERDLASDEMKPSDELPSCDCNTFDTTFFSEEIRIFRYDHDKAKSCNPEEGSIK